MAGGGARVWRFDGFELDLANRSLRRGEREIALGSRYFDALVLLASHPGELVTKDHFMGEVWRGIPVTDEALTQCIRTLRRALDDDASDPRYVATVPKHGYRFLADVERGEGVDRTRGHGGALAGRIAGAATIGGGTAGALGGATYGVLATDGGGRAVLVMVLLVAALGVLGGAGLGLGMAAAEAFRRESTLALIGGGAAGGMLVGAFGETLGRDAIAALTGASVPQTTGLMEGAILGLAAGSAVALSLHTALRRRAVLVLGALAGALAGLAIALTGGSLLGRSLMFLESAFPRSDLAMARIGHLFGEAGFHHVTQAASSGLEGAIFVACIAWASLYLRRT